MHATRQVRPVAAAALLVMAIALSACGGDDDPQAGDQQLTVQQAAADSARAAEDAAAGLRRAIAPEIHFAFDRSDVRAGDRSVLDAKVQALQANPGTRIRIAGHTDVRGPADYNDALGRRRAESARQYLVRGGIEGSRIETVSYGESQPANPGSSREAHAENRRAEFEVLP